MDRAPIVIDVMLTLDQVCHILQLPVEELDFHVDYRGVNQGLDRAAPQDRMEAICLSDFDDNATWRVPMSSFIRYCHARGWHPETMIVTPTIQIHQKQENPEE